MPIRICSNVTSLACHIYSIMLLTICTVTVLSGDEMSCNLQLTRLSCALHITAFGFHVVSWLHQQFATLQWILKTSLGYVIWTTTGSWDISRITVYWGGSCTVHRATGRTRELRKRKQSYVSTSCAAPAARQRNWRRTRCLKERDCPYGSCSGSCISGRIAWQWWRRRPRWDWCNGISTSGKLLLIYLHSCNIITAPDYVSNYSLGLGLRLGDQDFTR